LTHTDDVDACRRLIAACPLGGGSLTGVHPLGKRRGVTASRLSWWRRSHAALRRFVAELVRRCRERGRTALFRALRITGACVAAFVVAQLVGLDEPPPLVAALTALLVVQATLASTLVNGVQRVLAVVLGVMLAVGFVSVVGLNWWSLGVLVAASIVAGQILRLGPHLVEVPISAMLVLSVGYTAAAESTGFGRIVETFIGAAVGVLVNVAFPPAVQTRYAGQAVTKYAGEIASLLVEAATAMAAGPVEAYEAERWLEDARRLNRHAPRVDRALAEADESRTLNVRAIGTPKVDRSLRDGLEALEHSSVAMRTLFRAVLEGTREHPDPAYAEEVRLAAAALLSEMAAVVRTFGDLIHDEIEEPGSPDETELTAALVTLREHRAQLQALLLDDPRRRAGMWEFAAVLVTVADRLVAELDVVEHARTRAELGDAVRARLRAAAALERLRDTTVGRIVPHEHDHDHNHERGDAPRPDA
jgi:hypothetical protein